MASKKNDDVVGKNGLPVFTAEERAAAGSQKALLFVHLAAPAIGVGIAYGVYTFGNTTQFDSRLALLKSYDLQWALLSAVIFNRLCAQLNMYPMAAKSMVFKSGSGNLRANMQLFETKGSNNAGQIVALVEDGDIGVYNRANRSLTHFVENMGGLLSCSALSSFIAPFPSFGFMSLFATGRVMHQVGYTQGYGSHGIGFLVSTIATGALEGICLFGALKIMNVL